MRGLSSIFNEMSRPAPVSASAFKVDDVQLDALMRNYCFDLDCVMAREKVKSNYVVMGNDAALRAIRRLNASAHDIEYIAAFTGEAGVDTAYMLRAVAQNMAADPLLKNAKMMTLDWMAIGRSAQFNGEEVQALLPMFEGLAERGGVFQGSKIILGIDNVDRSNELMGVSFAKGAKPFIENFYKPIFEGRLGLVITGTEQGMSQLLGRDSGIAIRTEQIKVLPINQACRLRLFPKIKLKKP